MTSTTPALERFIQRLSPVLKHVTMHRFLWLFTAVCAFIAWNRGLMLLYGMVAFLLAVLFISYLYHLINLRGITVHSEFPDVIEAGNAFDARYRLASSGTRHFVSIAHTWHNTTLCDKGSEESSFTSLHLFVVRFKKQCQLSKSALFRHRGIYTAHRYELESGYPLGLLTQTKTLPCKTKQQALHVLPETFRVGNIPLLRSDRASTGTLASQATGNMDEFSGIRRYQRGDAFNMIHWPTTAKQISRGQPWMAKDIESLDSPNVLIILNQFDIHDSASFERMLSIASSIGQHVSQIGFPVVICGVDTLVSNQDNVAQDAKSTLSSHASHQHHAGAAILDTLWHVKLQPLERYVAENLKKLSGIRSASSSMMPTAHRYYPELISSAMSNFFQANVVMTFSHSGVTLPTSQKTHLDICLNKRTNTLSKRLGAHGARYDINPSQSLHAISSLFHDEPQAVHTEGSTLTDEHNTEPYQGVHADA